jgi:hypothetical protein
MAEPDRRESRRSCSTERPGRASSLATELLSAVGGRGAYPKLLFSLEAGPLCSLAPESSGGCGEVRAERVEMASLQVVSPGGCNTTGAARVRRALRKQGNALKVALKPWFDEEGRLNMASRWGPLGKRAERFLDDVVGLDLLRDMAEFFQAFAPLYEGFRKRAQSVEQLLRAPRTRFLVVSGPGSERIPDTLFFARRLEQAGYHLGPILVNRVHPRYLVEGAPPSADPGRPNGWELLSWLGERDCRGLAELATLVSREQPVIDIPLLPGEPTDLPSLESLGWLVEERLAEWQRFVSRSS